MKRFKNLAIIPARGGSKRIPRKNIRDFFGSPIIKYSIEACLKSGIFDEVMVSTEDSEIASISKSLGASVPFFREEKTSDDFAMIADVLSEVILKYQESGKVFDNVCYVAPCAPFLSPELLNSAYNEFVEKKADKLLSVVKYSFPIQRSLKIEDGFLSSAFPEYEQSRSQDLEPRYHDAGMFNFSKTQLILDKRIVSGCSVCAYELSESEAQDIDTLEDWSMAEIKYKLLNKEAGVGIE